MSSNELTAAVLVGGESRRMGQDKALLTIGPGGETVLETVVRTVGEITRDIVLTGADASPYAFTGLPWVADVIPGAGPLGGIHAALANAGNSHLLVVACDMPFLNMGLLQYMASLPRDYDVLLPVVDRPQPLHAIYARTCLPYIEASIRSGRNKVSGWFSQANVGTIDRETVQQYDPDLRSWFNMNTPEDLALARRWVAESPAPGSRG